jgi:hypothetical protein
MFCHCTAIAQGQCSAIAAIAQGQCSVIAAIAKRQCGKNLSHYGITRSIWTVQVTIK